MKHSLILLAAVAVTFIFFAAESSAQNTDKCLTCHGVPPIELSENSPFNPGAHPAHKEIECKECHTEIGEDGHDNGIISIKSELGYQFGQKVSWPGSGGGSCGGKTATPYPLGCHETNKQQKCYWLPGKACEK